MAWCSAAESVSDGVGVGNIGRCGKGDIEARNHSKQGRIDRSVSPPKANLTHKLNHTRDIGRILGATAVQARSSASVFR